jgi:UDP-N-acetyl-2-amino-2-deoxyglucuronate dehydrogenase
MTEEVGMDKVKVGLVGAGWIGQHHGTNVAKNPGAELAAVCDPEPAKAKAFLERIGVKARVYSSFDELLKQDDIPTVVIASPNASHAAQAVAAAQAGRHFYVEKPLAITLEDCRKVASAARAAGVKSAMGYHRRYNPLALHARSLLAEGKLGDLVLAESDYFHFVPGNLDIWSWLGDDKVAGSLIHAGTGHNVDLLRYFAGEVTEVSCFKDVRMPRKIQVKTEDIAIINLRFQSGVLGRVGLFLGPILPFTFTLRLFGTKGSIDDNRLWLDSIPDFAETGRENDFIELPRSWVPDNVQGGISETWKACLDAFIDDVRLGRAPANDAESGFRTAAVCFAALQSAATGQAVKPETL